jgi:hypothetical protein
MGKASDSDYDGAHSGALWRQLHDALDGTDDDIALTDYAKLDLGDRIQHCREILGLSESVGDLTDRFVADQVVKTWLSEERKMRARRQ